LFGCYRLDTMETQKIVCKNVFYRLSRGYPSWFESVQPLVFKNGCSNFIDYNCKLCAYFIRFVKSLQIKNKSIRIEALEDFNVCQEYLKTHNWQLHTIFCLQNGSI
jgi:hypothetical protein